MLFLKKLKKLKKSKEKFKNVPRKKENRRDYINIISNYSNNVNTGRGNGKELNRIYNSSRNNGRVILWRGSFKLQ